MNNDYIMIEPEDMPLKEGESWWIVHPNESRCEFKAPPTAVAYCMRNLLDCFKEGTVYTIVKNDEHGGWITLRTSAKYVEMPYYIFARYFDSEAFIRGRFTFDPDKAVPFDYNPTLPRDPKKSEQLGMFKDDE